MLDLTQSDKIMFTEKSSSSEEEKVNTEILIPVEGNISTCDEFQYKPFFQLLDAVTIRHEGNLEQLPQSEQTLKEFIQKNHYKAITPTYYVIVRNCETHLNNCIIDIYIGVANQ